MSVSQISLCAPDHVVIKVYDAGVFVASGPFDDMPFVRDRQVHPVSGCLVSSGIDCETRKHPPREARIRRNTPTGRGPDVDQPFRLAFVRRRVAGCLPGDEDVLSIHAVHVSRDSMHALPGDVPSSVRIREREPFMPGAVAGNTIPDVAADFVERDRSVDGQQGSIAELYVLLPLPRRLGGVTPDYKCYRGAEHRQPAPGGKCVRNAIEHRYRPHDCIVIPHLVLGEPIIAIQSACRIRLLRVDFPRLTSASGAAKKGAEAP